MSGVISCSACGADNMLPEGKTTMYCAFCGKPIEKIIPKTVGTERRINKSEIVNGKLAFKNRGIESLEEIIDLYSDSEIEEIEILNLSDNNIKSLKGISRFRLHNFDMSNNDIRIVDEIPSFAMFPHPMIKHYAGTATGESFIDFWPFSFRNNRNLQEISDNVVEKINSANFLRFKLVFQGCTKFNYDCLCKINFNKILKTSYKYSWLYIGKKTEFVENVHDLSNEAWIKIIVDPDIELPMTLKQMGFVKSFEENDTAWLLEKKQNSNIRSNNDSSSSNQKLIGVIIFIFVLLCACYRMCK